MGDQFDFVRKRIKIIEPVTSLEVNYYLDDRIIKTANAQVKLCLIVYYFTKSFWEATHLFT